ncbi:MAG: tripeptide aminopeptidase PepT, partial [Candidatus Aminicenantales bacterium]
TLITTDGTTLLGADDKAGVAVIMEALHWLLEHPEIAHGPIHAWFTCDEEIGHGVDHLDGYLNDRAAPVACYTLDGQGAGSIDVETFSADLAVVTVHGVNLHPGVAKGRMVNAVRVAADFLARLPRAVSPEMTEDRQGFLHPYEMAGGVAELRMRILLRDFQTDGLGRLEALLRQAAEATIRQFPGAKIELAVQSQYRNMAAGLAKEPRAVAYAQQAWERLAGSTAASGRISGQDARAPAAELTIVRGGTDGSRLTEEGLPTPNLATGQHSPHSKLEWACLDEMLVAVEWLVAIAQRWGED